MSRQADSQGVMVTGDRSEQLENRLMLTTFTVDTNLDVVNGADGLTSLREAITAANDNAGADDIQFAGDFGFAGSITLALGELTITEELTIDGSTATEGFVFVDGADLSRVFNINTTDAVLIDSVDITGGAAVDGAGILNNGSALTYQNGIISNNNATGSGGGIFNMAGTVSIDNSGFNDNTAVRAGGGIEDQSNNANAITITNSDMDGNSADGGLAGPGNGGALHVTGSGNVTITNTEVVNNTAASEGGGLWNGTGTMTINGNSQIIGNEAQGAAADNGGGGIFNAGGTVNITGGNVNGNDATGTSGSGGGILNDGGTLTVTGAIIDTNTANRAGGGIEATAGTTNTLTSVTLSGNVAGRAGSAAPGNGGGLHITGNGDATINGGTVSGNFAAAEGGGLWNGSGTMTIDGTTITGNAAAGNGADQGGGGVFNAGGTLDIDNATINNNLAAAATTFSLDGSQEVPPVTTTAAGEAIAQFDPATGTFRLDLFVTGLELPTNPGGLPDLTMAHVHQAAPGVNGPVIIDLLALGSFVEENGGLRLTLDGEIFPEVNIPDLLAGDTYVNIHSDDNMSGEIRGQITVPTTMGSGGGILNDQGTLTVDNSTIDGNIASRAGGGIETNVGMTTLTNVTLSNNVAGPDGAATPGNGGGLHVTGAGDVLIDGGTITGNAAAAEGGGLWNGTGTMTISDASGNVLIDNNSASGDAADQGGGGVFNAGGTVLIQDNGGNTVTISNNFATGTAGSGGGILNDANGILTVTGAIISGNSANRAGGGIEITAGTTNTLTNVSLDSNAAGPAGFAAPGNGGGLHITGMGDVTINGGSVTNNFAAEEGGGLWNGTGTMTIDGTTIDGNVSAGNGADQGGGGVFNAGGTLDIDNATISNNLASGATIVSLDGSQEVPPVTTTAAGQAIFQFDAENELFGLDLFVTGLELVDMTAAPELLMAHIHAGAAGTNGPVIFDLLSAGSFEAEPGGLRLVLFGETFPAGNIADLLAGETYINIHSSANMPGEIRGQITLPATMGSGGGILNDQGTITVDNTSITDNVASRAGGGIETNVGMTTLTNVDLSDNVAGPEGLATPGNGGGLHVTGAGDVLIDGGTITGNDAAAEGGGLWNGSGTMTISDASGNVLIDGNSASGDSADQGGGGVFNAGGTVVIEDNDMANTVTISNNVADGAAGSGGGILNDQGTLTVTSAVISGNSANRAGGGIETNIGLVTLTDVTLGGAAIADGNTANINGGGLHVTGSGTTNVNGGTVQNNVAAQEGGGLWNGTGTMTIDGVSITDNTASGDGADQGGGGVFNVGGPVIIQNGTTIAGNVADGSLGSGGGILHTGGSDLTITDSVISGNTANRAGGGIEVNTSLFPFVTLTNVNLDGNSAGIDIGSGASPAPGNGGGLHVTGQSAVGIDGGTVNNNVAAAEGGGLWNNTGDMDVFGTTISGNSAGGTLIDQGGGAIFNAGGNVDVNGSTLSGNTATSGFGNAIFNEGGAVAVGMTTLQGDIAGGDLTDESFDIFDANVTIISQGGTDITTVNGDASDDTFTVARDTVGAGVTLTATTSATFTINSDSEFLILFGDLGDDSFVVDFGNETNLGTVTTVAVDGDAEATADSLTLTGTAAFFKVEQTTTSATDGSFNINDAITVDYERIESIVDELVRGLSLNQTADQTIAEGNGPVDIVISSATDDGEIPVLTVGTLPDYASFVDNGNGQGVLTLNPATLDAGTMADITVTATVSNGSASDTFTVNVVSPDLSFPNNTIFAVNSAGRAVGNFGADNFFNAGSTFGTRAAIDVSDASIPVGTPAGIFNSTRFDFNGGPELQYAFPVNPGNYDVTLFFAEIYSPVFRAGGRVFDVSIEGVLVLDDFDVFTEAGAGNTGIARTFNVTSDGTLNIDFGHVVENPMVMGIQVVDLNGVPNIGPTLDPVTPLVNLLSGQSTTIDVSASDPEGDPITLTASGLPPFASFVDNGNGTGTITVNSTPTDEGIFGISVQASSGTPVLTDSASLSLRVAPFVPEPIPNESIGINAGGPAIAGDPDFVSDRAFQNGVGRDFRTGATIDTSDSSIPAGTPSGIFNSVSFDFNGGAELELDVPTQHTGITYEVTLFFVEIYRPTFRVGARVFDVSIDGVLVLDNFDVFAAAGAGNRGIARTFQITSDGNVDIDFGHVVENPALAGVTVQQIDQVFTSAP